MKKYLVAWILCFFFIPNVSITSAAATIPKITVSPIEPGDTEIEVVVTNYNPDMQGYLAIEVGEDTDENWVDESIYFSVLELEKGSKINFYYIDDNEKRTLLKTVTVSDLLLPELTFTNRLTAKSESIDYKITNYDARFEKGSLIIKTQDDSYEENIVKNSGSIALATPLKAGTPLKLYYKNDREYYLTTMKVLAKTPSKFIVRSSVTNRTTKLNVDYEENSSVTLKSGSKIYKGKEMNNGQYRLIIPNQKIGTKLTITATNNVGDKQTKTFIVKKQLGTTASMKSVTTKSTEVNGITGKTVKGDTVEVIIGTKTYKTSIKKSNGSYSVKIPKQKVNTLIKIRVIDRAGNILYTVSKRVSK